MTPTPYETMITPRSRRLRTTGLVLLVAAITMALYGFFVLMPSLKHSLVASRSADMSASAAIDAASKPQIVHVGDNEYAIGHSFGSVARQAAALNRRAKRVAAVKVLFAWSYWGVCGLLVVAMVFIAWLDLREVSRTYLNQRRAVWAETAGSLEANDRKSRSDLDSNEG